MRQHTNKKTSKRIALVHDYLNEAGGAERVLRVLSDMYPEAPIYTTFAKNGTAKGMFKDRKIVESKWAWFLKIGRFYSYFRFLLPHVWISIDLTDYDLVITSCSGYIARGFKTGKKTRVIAYCHTPPKWLYGYETPTGGKNTWWGRAYMWIVGPFVRNFDYVSAQRVDQWIANSKETARRIDKFYRKEARVVYPPVEINIPTIQHPNRHAGEYYLAVARVVGAKGLAEAAQAAKEAGRKLVLAGEPIGGRTVLDEIKTKGGEWVEIKGRVSDTELARLYIDAKAFIALAKDEDFGMTVIESMMCGTPVLTVNSGGYKETVKPGLTGILIEDNDTESVIKGIKQMEEISWDKENIIKWGSKFGREKFETGIRGILESRV